MSGFDFGMSDDGDEPNSRRAVIVASVALLVIVLLIAFVLAGPIKRLFGNGGDYSGEGSGSVTVVISDGATASDIGSTLAKAGVVRSTSAFVSAAADNDRSRNIGPGTYQLREHMKASDAVLLLLKPSSLVDYHVTIPEGFTAEAIVARLVAEAHLSQASLDAALANPTALGLPSYAHSADPAQAKNKVEGFLFPATYDIQPGETATEVLKAMVTRFDQAAADVHLAAGAKSLGLSEYDVVTLASIVQREGYLISDYPKIAEVFLNRLHQNMPLGSDATEFYLLGPGTTQLTAADLANPSPYNTRTNHGLPPTPINSPGEAALDGVLHHANTQDLYFVTIDKAGHTAYAKTLTQFNHLVAESVANGVHQ